MSHGADQPESEGLRLLVMGQYILCYGLARHLI
jgi:hypothetical protein